LLFRLLFENENLWKENFVLDKNFNALIALNSFRSIIGDAKFEEISKALANIKYSERINPIKSIIVFFCLFFSKKKFHFF